MTNNILFLVIVLFAIAMSCKTKHSAVANNATDNKTVVAPPDPFDSIRQRIYGEWTWIQTLCCGRTQRLTTPDITQMSMSRNFAEYDSVELYINDSLQSVVSYDIRFGFEGEKDTMITIGKGRPGYLKIKGDTMIINHGYIDLQTEWYVRKQL
jgi:hypothetical protein